MLIHSLLLMLLWCAGGVASAAGNEDILTESQRAWVREHPTVRWAPEQDYGPFVYADAIGNVQGLSVDFLRAIGEKTGLEFTPTAPMSLKDILEQAKQRQVDVITSLRPTPERAAYLSFTTPYISVPTTLVVRHDAAERNLAQMDGKPVAVGRGYAVEAYVRAHYPKVQWVAVSSDNEALRKLKTGEVQGMVADAASVEFVAKAERWNAYRIAGRVGFDYPLSFAYRSDWPQLGEILQRGMNALTAADRAQLTRQWLKPETSLQWQFGDMQPMLLAGGLLVLAVVVALWAHRGASKSDPPDQS